MRITLDNPEKLLLANMTANSLIVLEEKKDVLLVPQGALLSDAAGRHAQVYDGDTGSWEKRPVETGISDGRVVEVKGGLNQEESILLP